MPTAISGTNGVLQSYDFQVLTTGFSYTFAAGTTTLIANPAGTLATGTITMPASPADGMVITIESTQQITALTVQGNTGQSLVGGTITMRANQPESFIYRLTNTTWYPFAGATNSQLILDTAQASTSGTSIDFTGIPSWVKRITVMFNGVSTSGTSFRLVQIGAGSVTTSGYLSYCNQFDSAPSTTSSTQGFLIAENFTAATLSYGHVVITNISANSWVYSAVFGDSTPAVTLAGGSITLGGTLDRVRITTVNGTDTFDAGSINILYE
jgi:hypothetical protein